MADETVRIDGLPELLRALDVAQGELDDLQAGNTAAAATVLGAARVAVPRRSGALAASGQANTAGRQATVSFGGGRVPYAGVIEGGWHAHHISPQPYLRPAVESTRDQWIGSYERNLQAVLDKVERST